MTLPRLTLVRFFVCVAMTATLGGAALPARKTSTPDQSPQASPPPKLGGAYAGLDARRQRLIVDWVARFNELTGEKLQAEPFYDNRVKLSTKTTFDAVTNALMATRMTDASGAARGDALDLIERVESVKGQVLQAKGDRQFRMYVWLKEDALDRLDRSREFRRAADNTVYHKGYPINYRQQGGVPSIQISVATNRRRADIDVDYRSSGFPVAMFNGHLTASNSDVRAGNNYERHTNRWSGFQNWWRSLFGVRVDAGVSASEKESGTLPVSPRVGDKSIEVMVDDFLKAWLVDGDMLGALSYVSERSYACLAQDGDERFAFDRGLAPVQLLLQLRAAHEALGKRDSLDGLMVGVRLPMPRLKVVRQPYHARFVLYQVPDDVAAAFDCETRLTLGDNRRPSREYGHYYGATFYINGQKDQSMALLWGKDGGHWRIVSWQSEPADDEADLKAIEAEPATPVRAAGKAEPALVDAAKGFLESWFVRKDYDAAFGYLSTASYACYNLVRGDDAPAATSPEEAGRLIRASFERAGMQVGAQTKLDALLESSPPVHPAVRLLDHPYAQTFTLTDVPNALVRAVDCAARARGERIADSFALEYGQAHGMNFRFRTQGGETPLLRLLWTKENGAWRISAYDVEHP